MSAKQTPRPSKKPQAPVFHIKVTDAMEQKLADGASRTGLRKSDLFRLAAERGLDALLAGLTGDEKAA